MESSAVAKSKPLLPLMTPALIPGVLAGIAFVLLFGEPLRGLAGDWWNDPEAGHGLLLAPVAVWLAWRAGIVRDPAPARIAGAVCLTGSVLLRYASGLAAEIFTTRLSALGAVIGLVLFWLGWRQLRQWTLPILLLGLSIPLPSLITTTLALPLQFKASAMGAALLDWRHVPVQLTGNVILLPGHRLFVTEACSGLRSLTALLSLGVLISGLWLTMPVTRVFLVLMTIPVAILINAVRVFLTGFLVFFVSPELGEGFMHITEGWLMFVIAFGILGGIAWALTSGERWWRRTRAPAHE
jgi:exosortase